MTPDDFDGLPRDLVLCLDVLIHQRTPEAYRGLLRQLAPLARHGLPAYSKHPLLKTVCIDRTFYAPLARDDYRAYAEQVPDRFRFVVKAPSAVTAA